MSVATEHLSARQLLPTGPTAADTRFAECTNDSIIVRLTMTPNYLSRWLTSIHDQERLLRAPRRGEPSVMELLQELRDDERVGYARMHSIANTSNPDLDKLPDSQLRADGTPFPADRLPLSVMAEFRRLRQSTCSLLRSLPDSAWQRIGTSRLEHDWQIQGLAEALGEHDLGVLRQVDEALQQIDVRQDVNAASRISLDELLRITPVQLRSR